MNTGLQSTAEEIDLGDLKENFIWVNVLIISFYKVAVKYCNGFQ